MNVIDDYEERRKLRRSRFRWRILAFLAVLVAIGAVVSQMGGPMGPHVARYSVFGVITSDSARDALLDKIAQNDEAKALVLNIDSPGGTVAGSEALYESIRRIAEKKPVIATMGEVAASGGYIAALAADHIVARQTSITGSVGVIFQAPNAHELLEKVGVKMVEMRSGPLKAQPSPFQPVDPDVIESEQVLIEDSFDWFLSLVEERRDIGENALEVIAKGGVFTGRMAQDIGLIDTLGGERVARAWLASNEDVPVGLEIHDYEIPLEEDGLLGMILGKAPGGEILSNMLKPGLMAIYR